MTDRDRLIKIVKDSLVRHIDKTCLLAENITNDLLANGVMVLPIPIGAVVYEIRARGKRRYNGRKFDYAISSKLMFENAVRCAEELYVKEKLFTKTDRVRLNKSVFLNECDAHNEIERWVNRER